jgi:hypothetical protein
LLLASGKRGGRIRIRRGQQRGTAVKVEGRGGIGGGGGSGSGSGSGGGRRARLDFDFRFPREHRLLSLGRRRRQNGAFRGLVVCFSLGGQGRERLGGRSGRWIRVRAPCAGGSNRWGLRLRAHPCRGSGGSRGLGRDLGDQRALLALARLDDQGRDQDRNREPHGQRSPRMAADRAQTQHRGTDPSAWRRPLPLAVSLSLALAGGTLGDGW